MAFCVGGDSQRHGLNQGSRKFSTNRSQPALENSINFQSSDWVRRVLGPSDQFDYDHSNGNNG